MGSEEDRIILRNFIGRIHHLDTLSGQIPDHGLIVDYITQHGHVTVFLCSVFSHLDGPSDSSTKATAFGHIDCDA
jgi:hypothetical protein